MRGFYVTREYDGEWGVYWTVRYPDGAPAISLHVEIEARIDCAMRNEHAEVCA